MKIGIDPGLTGAIALLNDNLECVELADMPVIPLGINHQQVNAPELGKILRRFEYKHATEFIDVYIEQVNAMPGQGVTSMFSFGTSYGIAIGVCNQFPTHFVRPNAWKKVAGLIGKPKDAARTLAQQLYPGLDLSHKKDVGRADALLIARFGFLV